MEQYKVDRSDIQVSVGAIAARLLGHMAEHGACDWELALAMEQFPEIVREGLERLAQSIEDDVNWKVEQLRNSWEKSRPLVVDRSLS